MDEFESFLTSMLSFANSSMLEWAIVVFIAVAFVISLGFLSGFILKFLINKSSITKTIWDDIAFKSLRLPTTLLIWVVGLTYTAELAWDIAEHKNLLILTSNIRLLGVIFCFVLFFLRFLTLGERAFLHYREKQDRKVDLATVRAFNKILKASVIITGILMVLNTMGYSISGVLAFGGIGGIAIGFAAKDMLSNFFGGLMVYLDRPFVEGDWICSPDREIEGTVENIGWRQTRIRAFARHPIYVPNSVFAQITIENKSRMECRRIYEVIGVRYDDIEKVKAIVSSIKEMLQAHPDISTDRVLIVNLNEFNESSVDIMIYTYTKTSQWVLFHEIKQDIMLKIAEIIDRCGGEIAFPTRTLHLSDDSNQQIENRKATN